MRPTAAVRAASRVIPFVLPQLHVGTDICHVSRVYAILRKAKPASSSTSPVSSPPKQTTASRLIRRVLTPSEVDALGSADKTALASPSTITAHAAVALLAKGVSLPQDEEAGTSAPPNESSPLWLAARFLAGRFAAKEAAIKAHPHLPGLTLQDVRIARRNTDKDKDSAGDAVVRHRNANSGPPLAFVRVYPLERSSTDDAKDDVVVEQEARISISHDGEYATAVCLGVEVT